MTVPNDRESPQQGQAILVAFRGRTESHGWSEVVCRHVALGDHASMLEEPVPPGPSSPPSLDSNGLFHVTMVWAWAPFAATQHRPREAGGRRVNTGALEDSIGHAVVWAWFRIFGSNARRDPAPGTSA